MNWCGAIDAVLNIGANGIHIVGSAATGYSLSPLKPGRPFRKPGVSGPASDIDVALVNQGLFDHAWETILTHDRSRRLQMSYDARAKTRTDVYWGVVAQKSLPVAKTWDLLTDYQLRGAPSENGPKASPAIDRSCRILTARRWSASIRMRPKSLTKPRVLSVIV
jgi:hypothetical protein